MIGVNRKAIIFTESRRTQDYLKNFLEGSHCRLGGSRRYVSFPMLRPHAWP